MTHHCRPGPSPKLRTILRGNPSFTGFQRSWLRPLLRLYHGPNSPSIQSCCLHFLSARCSQKHFLKNLLLGNLCLRSCVMGNPGFYTIQHMSLHNMKSCFVWFKLYVRGIVQFAFLPSNYIFFWFICVYLCSSTLFILTGFWKIPQFTYLLPY